MLSYFDLITVCTVAGILGILTLYIVVAYKKGWLRRDLKASESYFLCPNTKCHRMFQDPIWLTDLSKTPPDHYQACPHCSTNLQLSPSFKSIEERPKPESALKATPMTKDLKSEERRPQIPKEKVSERAGIIREISKPATSGAGLTQRLEKTSPPPPKTQSPTIEFRKETPPKPVEMPKKPDEKKPTDRPRACSHYFGYVKTLPKNTSIPDECLWCPWIVDCLAGKQKVEA